MRMSARNPLKKDAMAPKTARRDASPYPEGQIQEGRAKPPAEPAPFQRAAGSGTITVIVPAANEGPRLAAAVGIIGRAAAHRFADYEILIVDNGSTDDTGAVADRLAAGDPHIRVFHDARPLGLGGVIGLGVREARMMFVTRVNGSGTEPEETLDRIFALAGTADLIIPYVPDMSARPPLRRWLSALFPRLLNVLFGLQLRYYNQSILCRTELARRIRVRTRSHAYPAEFVIKAIKSGCGYQEVAVESLSERSGATSKAFRLSNVFGVGIFLMRTWWDVRRGRLR
jgi:dolichol-phosphate mannosyltransferase